MWSQENRLSCAVSCFFPKVMGEIDYSVDIDYYCDLIDELAYTQKTGETEVPDHDAV